MPYLLIIINISLMSIGQLFFKQSANFFNNNGQLSFILKYLLNPWFYAAVFSFAISTFIWVKILTQMKLSVAYPILSISYILTTVGAMILFHEKFSLINFLGIFFIMIGVSLVSIK